MRRVLLGSCLALVTFAQAGVAQRTLNVPRDYSSIQRAIAAAVPSDIAAVVPSDTVLVAPGTYEGSILLAKPITLKSSRGAAVMTLRSGGPVVDINAIGYLYDVVLDGFTISGGDGMRNYGGGICLTGRPLIQNNRIVDNRIESPWRGS